MSYAFYRCSEDCDGKPCFVAYPIDVPLPRKCVYSSGSCRWERVELSEFVDAVFEDKILSEEARKAIKKLEQIREILEADAR